MSHKKSKKLTRAFIQRLPAVGVIEARRSVDKFCHDIFGHFESCRPFRAGGLSLLSFRWPGLMASPEIGYGFPPISILASAASIEQVPRSSGCADEISIPHIRIVCKNVLPAACPSRGGLAGDTEQGR